MKRNLLLSVAIILLACCATACAFWIHSYWRCDSVMRYAGHDLAALSSSRGGIILERYRFPETFPHRWYWGSQEPLNPRLLSEHWFAGFGYRNLRPLNDMRNWVVPHWFVVLLFGVSGGIALRRWRRIARHPLGHCANCGYDLRATPHAGTQVLPVCPECGSASSRSSDLVHQVATVPHSGQRSGVARRS